jgi:outer membrane protein assembly factor BamB
MEITAVLLSNPDIIQGIVPTVLIPFALVSVWASIIATFLAGLFGITLRTEGPKRLLEFLLTPRILLSAMLVNTIVAVGFVSYRHIQNRPAMLMAIKNANATNAASTLSYNDHLGSATVFANKVTPEVSKISGLESVWTVKLPEGAFREAAMSGDALFYGTDDGRVYELDAVNGIIRRSFFIGTPVSPSPLIWNGFLYLGEGTHYTHYARIYKFDLASGKFLGSFATKGHTEGQPKVGYKSNGDPIMFAVAGSDGLYAFDPLSMNQLWHVNDGHIDAEVLIEDGVVYAGTGREKGNAQLYKSFAAAYDIDSGTTLWKRELTGSSWMSPVLFEDQVCFITGEIYFKTDLGGLSCFAKATGTPTFDQRFLSPIVSTPLRIGDHIYLADLYGKLCSIHMPSRQIAWCHETNAQKESISSIQYDPYRNVLLYPSRDNGLFVLNPATGEELLHWQPENPEWTKTYAGVNVTASYWYTIDMKGHVRALRPVTGESH